jgi:hypothetical protein
MQEGGKGTTRPAQFRNSHLVEMGWNAIDEPGCYLLIETGDLARIPQEALAPGHSPLVILTSQKEARVARLSENPAEPISVLRAIAANNDYHVAF